MALGEVVASGLVDVQAESVDPQLFGQASLTSVNVPLSSDVKQTLTINLKPAESNSTTIVDNCSLNLSPNDASGQLSVLAIFASLQSDSGTPLGFSVGAQISVPPQVTMPKLVGSSLVWTFEFSPLREVLTGQTPANMQVAFQATVRNADGAAAHTFAMFGSVVWRAARRSRIG